MISAKHTAQGLAQRKSSQVGPGLYWLFQRRQTWQVNTVANVEAQSPSLFSYFLVFSLLSLSDALTVAWSLPTPTQSPTVCPSTSSVLSFPPNVVVHLSVGLSHLTQCLTENIPCMTPISETQPAPMVHNVIYYRPGRLHFPDKLPAPHPPPASSI